MIELRPLSLGDLNQAKSADASGSAVDGHAAAAASAASVSAPSAAAISALMAAAADLVRRRRAVEERTESRGTISEGRRGVLAELARSGPRTVPQVARARSVTRQHVQALVNALAREGWVEFADNPEHRRSRLVRLTDAGRAWLTEAAEREDRCLSRLELHLSDEEVRAATEILEAVGHALSNEAGTR